MFCTCIHALHMSTMIQIRNVPDPIHRTLKARAAEEGLSLSDYLLRELRQIAARPTPAQMLERLSAREPVRTRESVAAMVRRERDAR
jgi:plasmid stability protein